MTDIALWIDFESAGPDLPDAERDTVLEAAWCFTRRYPPEALRYSRAEIDQWQLTPLRSRLCTLTPRGRGGATDHFAPRLDGGSVEWPERTGAAQRRIHAESGFDHVHARASRDLILDHGAELDRLIVDDLHRAVAAVGGSLTTAEETDRVTVYLAGDGVGHYDRGLIDRECPRVARHLHYRPIDVSVAVQTLSDVQESPTRALMAIDDNVRRDYVRALSCLDVDDDARVVEGGVEVWLDLGTVDPHRAAPDVTRAMLAYLSGRYRIGQALSREAF